MTGSQNSGAQNKKTKWKITFRKGIALPFASEGMPPASCESVSVYDSAVMAVKTTESSF